MHKCKYKLKGSWKNGYVGYTAATLNFHLRLMW